MGAVQAVQAGRQDDVDAGGASPEAGAGEAGDGAVLSVQAGGVDQPAAPHSVHLPGDTAHVPAPSAGGHS